MLSGLSLRGRLWLLGIASSLGMIVLALSAIVFAARSEAIFAKFVQETIAMRHSAALVYANGLQKGQAIRNILLDPGKKTAYDNFNNADKVFGQEIERLHSMLAAQEMTREIAARLKKNVDQWQPLQQQVIELVKAGNGEESKTLLVTKETPAWRLVRDDLLEIGKIAESAAERDRAGLIAGIEQGRWLSIGFSIVSLLLVTGIIVFVGRGIFRQVGGEPQEASAALTRIAQGDLTQALAVLPGDETSILAAMRTMQAQIRQLIAETVKSADAVVEESESMLADASRLAQSAEDQSATTSAIAAAVQEFTVSISVMSGNADDAGQISGQSERQARDSLNAVTSATEIIQHLASNMSEASTTMEDLSTKVSNITGIVNTIRDIADQTNLLALNAAIEAARAGEQGRGFAVVADEVRKLAELTTRSTQQISDIVGGVRQANDAAFQSITRAKEQALAGASQTEEIRTAVAQMDQSSARVSEAIAAIAESLREQSATSADIASRVEVIAQGIEHTHDAADKSRQRSGALVNLSHSLKQEVGKFRV
ncbi:MAG: methyl-accepting chemotaxis protein [Propionivibrio sp.]|nr:methyl-accepting chemotaxis protein [Propionivibrio sp.]